MIVGKTRLHFHEGINTSSYLEHVGAMQLC